MEGFSVKSFAGFWCKKLCSVLVHKAVQGFGAISCEGFFLQKVAQGFNVKSCGSF